MIGSSKINDTTNDLERLQDLFDLGLNNTEISRIYRTNSGESISRIHVSQIRRGKRWNIDNRSFIMKHELGTQDTIETIVSDFTYKTVISPVLTDTDIFYIYLTYINSTPNIDTNTTLMVNKPTRSDLIEYHIKHILR